MISLGTSRPSCRVHRDSIRVLTTSPNSGRTFDDAKLAFPFRPANATTDNSQHQSLTDNASHTSTNFVPAALSSVAHNSRAVATPKSAQLPPSTHKRDARKVETVPAHQSPEDKRLVDLSATGASSAPNGTSSAVESTLAAQVPSRVSAEATTPPTIDQTSPHPPAKTVHLPPEHVQEENLRKRQAAEGKAKALDLESQRTPRPTVPHIQAPTEVPSSPSSTVGPHSAATPLPPEESPDTSPGSDKPDDEEVLPPEDLRQSPEELRAKDQHDRYHAAQKEAARQQARGSVETPDDQLKWEEQEAAARDAEEQAARAENVLGLKTDHEALNGKDSADVEMSEAAQSGSDHAIGTGKTSDRDGKVPALDDSATTAELSPTHDRTHLNDPNSLKASQKSITNSTSHNTVSQNSARPGETDEDNDNITVTPRNRNVEAAESSVAPGSPKSALAGSLSKTPTKRKPSHDLTAAARLGEQHDATSVEQQTSPSSRPAQPETKTVSPSVLRRSSQPAGRPRAQPRMPSDFGGQEGMETALEQLISLKGAASDPDKDYLEPLFRIQAHDSPNNTFSKSLPDLVKMAPKALTTEDHFTQLHERIDFRVLRRIYQLQNANKWSLRQMDKAKEPEPPVSHHDYMIAEMRSMRKDFQAERKMKKSVCAWLAQRCAQWVGATPEERLSLQVKVKPRVRVRSLSNSTESVPDLDQAGESAPEDDLLPPTPKEDPSISSSLVIPPELFASVEQLQQNGKLNKVLDGLPQIGLVHQPMQPSLRPVAAVSKFVDGKVLPIHRAPIRKRSRYDYEDEEEGLHAQPALKKAREAAIESFPDPECALFQAENKAVRDRLHSNNVFRPPSEFLMPAITFYEHRNGSQWTWDDDQRLRKLAKDYSFNWSLISDELAIPGTYKSSYDRRTPWECFERWVELESLPADMKRTIYFKTWFQRLETSAQAAERRYQAQVALLAQQAQANNTMPRELARRKLTPTRVEKRRNSRYLWVIDGCRKIAKKREQQAWKFAESMFFSACEPSMSLTESPAARTASQRKTQADPNPQRQLLTPQEISKKRHQQDMATQAALREQRQKYLEQQARIIAARQAQQAQQQQAQQAQQQHTGQQAQHQQQVAGAPNVQQQRAVGANMTPQQAQQAAMMAAQASHSQQGRQNMQIPANMNRLAMSQANGQPMTAAQIQQARAAMAQHPNIQQQMAHAQARNAQYVGQQFQMANGSIASPGAMTAQQLQQQQALLAAYNAQQHQVANSGQATVGAQNGTNQQGSSASPNMPPPPNPQHGQPGQLSSGHIPQIIQIKNQLRANNPNLADDQLTALATQQMQAKNQPQTANHQHQARQNAMNAAAGISGTPSHAVMQAYAHGQQNGYVNGTPVSKGNNGMYMNGTGDGTPGSQSQTPQSAGATAIATPQQQAYAQKMWQRQMAQMQQRQSPNTTHAGLANSSPNISHASPNMTPASPSGQSQQQQPTQQQYSANMVNIANMTAGAGQRPPSRSATPQMQRLGSSGSVHQGLQSPGAIPQNSPRNLQASMAR